MTDFCGGSLIKLIPSEGGRLCKVGGVPPMVRLWL